MKQLGQVCAALRRKNRVHSALLAGCCFFSVLLITAYGIMMRSPTILAVLPEGGDSRKQVLMIFVMAVIGCAMFTVYASGLFFRHRSRQTGILLALGASRLQLRRQLNRELAVLAAVSCAAGAVLAAPLAWGIWQLFRLFVVDSAQMTLRFEPRAWAIALGFSVFVAVLLFAAGARCAGPTSSRRCRRCTAANPSGRCPAGTARWGFFCWRRAACWAILRPRCL